MCRSDLSVGLCAQVVVAPYPYCLHCPVRAAHPDGASWYKVGWPCTCSLIFKTSPAAELRSTPASWRHSGAE